jgi:hypothetical protein
MPHGLTPLEARELLARLRWPIEQGRVQSERKWALDAGLSPGTIHAMVARLSKPSEGADVQLGTLKRLAEAAHLRPMWLAFGEGSPEPGEPGRADTAPPNAFDVVVMYHARDIPPRWPRDVVEAFRATKGLFAGMTPEEVIRTLDAAADGVQKLIAAGPGSVRRRKTRP